MTVAAGDLLCLLLKLEVRSAGPITVRQVNNLSSDYFIKITNKLSFPKL